MLEYFVEFDGINGCTEGDIWGETYEEIIAQVKDFLAELGGGHADIFDEDGDFVEDIEVQHILC